MSECERVIEQVSERASECARGRVSYGSVSE